MIDLFTSFKLIIKEKIAELINKLETFFKNTIKEIKYRYHIFRYLINTIFMFLGCILILKLSSQYIRVDESIASYNELYDFASTLVGTYAGFFPVMMSYVYFIIREQKAIAISSIKQTIHYMEYFIVIVGIIIPFWYYKKIIFRNISLVNDGWICGYICIVLVLFAWTLCALYRLLNFTLADKLFDRIIYAYDVYEYFLIEKEKTGKYIIDCAYEKIFLIIEGIYQLLFTALKNDLAKDFDEMFCKVNKRLEELFIEPRKSIFLFDKDPDKYIKFYKDILKNQHSLIIKLYESNHITDAHEALYLLENLLPDSSVELDNNVTKKGNVRKYQDLIKVYMTVICELGLSLYLKGVIMTPLMELLLHVMVKKEFLELYIYIYRVWIIKAIENNDIKQEVLLSYSMMGLVEGSGFWNNKQTLDDEYKKMEMVIANQTNEQIEREKNRYVGMCIFVLLNAAVKCIELSQYQSAGFMVKFIVSNFPEDVTNDCFFRLDQKNGHDEKFENAGEYKCISGISSFNINYKTYKYCLQKLVLLLYCQQKYMLEKEIVIGNALKKKIDLKSFIGRNPEYIYKKIESARDKYGLVCLKDDAFLRKIKRDIFDLESNKN